MEKLTHIQRFRLSEKTNNNLNQLKKHGINKARFVRQAIDEKLERELPRLIKSKKEYTPF